MEPHAPYEGIEFPFLAKAMPGRGPAGRRALGKVPAAICCAVSLGILAASSAVLSAAAPARPAQPESTPATITVVSPLDSTQAGSQESNLGDLAADAVLDASHGQAQFALLPASELRSVVIPTGRIDCGQLIDSLRAASDNSDTVVLLSLTGAQIKKALAHGLSRLPAPYEGFLQVAGLRVVYDAGGHSPAVSSATLTATGESVSDTRTYTVATSRLLADGALGYFEVWSKSDILSDTGMPIAKALSDYALAHQPLDRRVEGRISSK